MNLPGTALAPSLPFPINICKCPLKGGHFPLPEGSGACRGSSEVTPSSARHHLRSEWAPHKKKAILYVGSAATQWVVALSGPREDSEGDKICGRSEELRRHPTGVLSRSGLQYPQCYPGQKLLGKSGDKQHHFHILGTRTSGIISSCKS